MDTCRTDLYEDAYLDIRGAIGAQTNLRPTDED